MLLFMHPGPAYCPVKNIPSPYDESYLPIQQPDHTSTNSFKSDDEPSISNGKSPHNSTTAPPTNNGAPPAYSNQYPTLPDLDDYEVGGNEQQYPQATYPGQNEYQHRGQPYSTERQPDETSRLINQ